MKKIPYTVFVLAAAAGLVLAPAGCGSDEPSTGEPPADAPTVDSDQAPGGAVAGAPGAAPEGAPAGASGGAADGAPGGASDGASAGAPGGADGAAPGFGFAGAVLHDLPPLPAEAEDGLVAETERDWAIASGTVEWIRAQRLETLPPGEVMAILASTFVGAPYEPGTLELPGEERLVVNLRTFDCVTLVEHALVLARLAADPAVDPDQADAFATTYRTELTHLRYRDGEIDGYPSRLHYFSEWIEQAVDRGLMEDITPDLVSDLDDRPIHFMTSNPDAYRQLGESPAYLETIRAIEQRLSATPRPYVPQDRIASVEDRIQNGDILAATSRVDGLDIAHTGLALRHEGRLHMIHAPLVGDSVEITDRPVAERMQDISGQTGIRVLRPLPRESDSPTEFP